MRAVLVLVGVVGCSNPSGLLLEVAASSAVKRVEVLVGQDCEGNCPDQVAPPALGLMDANLYAVHDSERFDAVHGADDVRFLITADRDKHLPVVAAIGFDENDVVIETGIVKDVPISTTDGVYWRLELAAAQPLVRTVAGSPPAEGTRRVLRWGTSNALLPSCVVLESWQGGEAKRFAFGPVGDTDCDEVSASECAPWAYKAENVPGLPGSTPCTFTTQIGAGDVCMVGERTCSEVGSATACGPVAKPYCVVPALCGCSEWDAMCVEGELAVSLHQAIHITCAVYLNDVGGSCGDPTLLYPLNIGDALLGGSTTKCLSVGLGTTASFGPFTSSITVGAGSLSVEKFDPMTCITELAWRGSGSMSDRRVFALASVAFDNNKNVVIPVAIDLLPQGCSATPQSRCTLDTVSTVESLALCTRPIPPASACQGVSGCGGPICNGVCCRTGEQCINGLCSCGGGPACGQLSECAALDPGGSAPCGDKCCGQPSEPLCDF